MTSSKTTNFYFFCLCTGWIKEIQEFNWWAVLVSVFLNFFSHTINFIRVAVMTNSASQCFWLIKLKARTVKRNLTASLLCDLPKNKKKKNYSHVLKTKNLFWNLRIYLEFNYYSPLSGFKAGTKSSYSRQLRASYTFCIIQLQLFPEAIWCLHWVKYSNPRLHDNASIIPSNGNILHVLYYSYDIVGIFGNFGTSTRI